MAHNSPFGYPWCCHFPNLLCCLWSLIGLLNLAASRLLRTLTYETPVWIVIFEISCCNMFSLGMNFDLILCLSCFLFEWRSHWGQRIILTPSSIWLDLSRFHGLIFILCEFFHVRAGFVSSIYFHLCQIQMLAWLRW